MGVASFPTRVESPDVGQDQDVPDPRPALLAILGWRAGEHGLDPAIHRLAHSWATSAQVEPSNEGRSELQPPTSAETPSQLCGRAWSPTPASAGMKPRREVAK
jgi:hypothetical protein